MHISIRLFSYMNSGVSPRSLLVGLRFGPCVATDCARLAKKYTPGCPMALWLRFSARLGSSGRSRDALGTLRGSIFEARTTVSSPFVASDMHASLDLQTLTKHCVGARISSFGVFALVSTSGENSLRTLLGAEFPLATRSTRVGKLPQRANLALETANLAPRTANSAAKPPNLPAKTAQLGVPRPFQTRA